METPIPFPNRAIDLIIGCAKEGFVQLVNSVTLISTQRHPNFYPRVTGHRRSLSVVNRVRQV